jgi:DNA-binding NtrC family response regulator
VSGEGQTVLVVDDDDSMRLLCRINLELEGYRILEADRLSTARELISTEEIDLVLLDVHLRGQEGYELIELARKRGTGMRVAIMSGTSNLRAERPAAADGLLAKPFKLDDLLETVRRLTGRPSRVAG